MQDLTASEVPPNVKHLERLQNGEPLPTDALELTAPSDFDFSTKPFSTENDHTLKIICADETYGFRFERDQFTNRAYITDILPNSTAATLASSFRTIQRKYVGAFITAINDTPVFTVDDASHELTQLRPTQISKFTVTIAPEPLPPKSLPDAADKELSLWQTAQYEPESSDPNLPRITAVELRAINRLQSVTILDDSIISNDEIDLLINVNTSNAATNEENALGLLTRRKLQTLPTCVEIQYLAPLSSAIALL
jgi:hypothetical protein